MVYGRVAGLRPGVCGCGAGGERGGERARRSERAAAQQRALEEGPSALIGARALAGMRVLRILPARLVHVLSSCCCWDSLRNARPRCVVAGDGTAMSTLRARGPRKRAASERGKPELCPAYNDG